MKKSTIDFLMLDAIDRIDRGAKIEDSRIELKREWVDSGKAARQIAAHANASRGEDVIWIIGLDEDDGLVGADPKELSDWWARVVSNFNEVAPSIDSISSKIKGVEIVALVFETERAPFVVKNLSHGKTGGGPVALEIPFREGAAVRSANRNDILKILVPAVSLPEIEILSAHISLSEVVKPPDTVVGHTVSLDIRGYLTFNTGKEIVIPFHRCKTLIQTSGNTARSTSLDIKIYPGNSEFENHSQNHAFPVKYTQSELVMSQSSTVQITGSHQVDVLPTWHDDGSLTTKISLSVVESDLSVNIVLNFKAAGEDRFGTKRWAYDSAA